MCQKKCDGGFHERYYQTVFYVADPVELPPVETEVVLWGDDAELAQWLKQHGVCTRPFASTATAREVILAAANPPASGGAVAFRELAQHIARGASVVFLSPSMFAQGDQSTAWAPLMNKGGVAGLPSWLYHIRENLGRSPVADRLLVNMLRHAARDVSKPLADLPADFDKPLETIGY